MLEKINMKFILNSCIIGVLAFAACKKKFETGPEKIFPQTIGTIKIDSIYKIYVNYYLRPAIKPTQFFRFKNAVALTCTVTADETSGNIYKQIFVADETGALQIKLTQPGGLYVGDEIKINLNNVTLNNIGRMIQLDSVDSETKIVKLSSGHHPVPEKLTMKQLLEKDADGILIRQSRLILLDSVEFLAGDKGKTFADPILKFSGDRTLLSLYGESVNVRSSGYANFADKTIPCSSGSLVAIAGQYNNEAQLTIRNFGEIRLTNVACPFETKTFEDGSLNSGGWTAHQVQGVVNWTAGSYRGQKFAICSNYSGGIYQACESWYISPAMDLSASVNPSFSFQNAFNYQGAPLEVLVSTNYLSGLPSSATWKTLSPKLSPGGFAWVNSGRISLSEDKSVRTRIAFKYSGSSVDGATWEIDDIAIYSE
jgi:hypothetical protein